MLQIRFCTGVFVTCLLLSINISLAGFDYSVEHGEVTIRGHSNPVGNLAIPTDINGYPVRRIGIFAFADSSSLETIDIPEGILEIGESAFSGCTALAAVSIPASVTHVGDSAFSGCTSLTSASMSNSVIHIGHSVFSGCTSLEDVVLPTGITSLPERIFENCHSLYTLTIPSGVTNISAGSFFNCHALEDINIPDGVVTIGADAFRGCSALKSISLPDSVTQIGWRIFRDCTSLESIVIPDSITEIRAFSFAGCTSLTNVFIPNTVTQIGGAAFADCRSLETVVLPALLTEISNGMFERCHALETIAIPEGVTRIGYRSFAECGELRSIVLPDGLLDIGEGAFWESGLESIVIPAGVTVIRPSTFSFSRSLVSVSLPPTLTRIEELAFASCSALTEIAIPTSVTHLGNRAFRSSGLVTITIPGSIIRIESHAFWGCGDLEQVTIEDGVLFIDMFAFSSCHALTAIYIPASVIGISNDAFLSCHSLVSINVHAENSNYSSLDGVLFNKERTSLVFYPAGKPGAYTVPASVTSLREFAFFESRGLTHVTLGSGLSEISGSAFYKCRFLKSVTIPGNITRINASAFRFCTALETVVFSEGLTHIMQGAFSWCTSLTDFTIPNSVTHIAGSAFEECSALRTVTLSDGMTTISPSTFENCSGLETIVLPSNLETIGGNAFRGCSALANINFPDSLTSIGAAAFRGCTALESVRIPHGVSMIAADTFRDCSGLREIVFPAGLVSIGASAFAGCEMLTNVRIPHGVTEIGQDAFRDCLSLQSIILPVSLENLHAGAFYNCNLLTKVTFLGNAPSVEHADLFPPSLRFIRRLPGTSGWGDSFAGYAVRVVPVITRSEVHDGGITFDVQAEARRTVVLEANVNLSADGWLPIASNSVSSGDTVTLTDPYSHLHTNLFYRVVATSMSPETRILVLQGDLDFGEVTSDQELTRELEIVNVGDAPLMVNSIILPDGFSAAWSGLIDSGATQTVVVTFSPADYSGYGGFVIIDSDATATSSNNVMPVTGMHVPELPTRGPYVVIDLSDGPDADWYPVSYYDAVPAGGWTSEYKTTKMVLRRIPAGNFMMGVPSTELGRIWSDRAPREVTLTQSYYMGIFPVTQRQWERVMGNWPSSHDNADYRERRPVEQVNYHDIRERVVEHLVVPLWPETSVVDADTFMGRLRTRTGLVTLDLPTEAQWEYACRAGTATALNSMYDLTNTGACPNMAIVGRYLYNTNDSPDGGTAEVGSYLPNAWGLYDMHGNVWEWCLDWHATGVAGNLDPKGPVTGSSRVLRGGSYVNGAASARSGARCSAPPSSKSGATGFRVAGVVLAEDTRIVSVIGDRDYGTIAVGEEIAGTLIIRNMGNLPLEVDGIDLPQGYSGEWSGTIAPWSTQMVSIVFSPAIDQTYAGKIVVHTDAAMGESTLQVSGSGFSGVDPNTAQYLVIDLSGGPDAAHYPVRYYATVPDGGWTDEYKTTKLVLRRILPGTFVIGSPSGELGRTHDEAPRNVTILKSYFIGVFPVTQRQWERVMGNWPSHFRNPDYRDSRPVEQVSFNIIREDADNNRTLDTSWPVSRAVGLNSFMGKLRVRTGLEWLDLPTEAQYEYACRAGTTTALNSGTNLTSTTDCPNLSALGRYQHNHPGGYSQDADASTSGGTAEVGSYAPNAWGLYDMHGNVKIRVLNWWSTVHSDGTDPVGPPSGGLRAIRGGGWMNNASFCRSAARRAFAIHQMNVGLRIVLHSP